jgi:hypothetical protein
MHVPYNSRLRIWVGFVFIELLDPDRYGIQVLKLPSNFANKYEIKSSNILYFHITGT